jgi:hypothetical protein
MRKALMSLIMAATVMTPIAAQARPDNDDGPRAQRGESRQQRSEARQQRAEPRQEARQQPQPQAQPQVRQQLAQRNRGDGNRGNRGDGNRGGRGDRPQQPSIYPQAWQGNPNDPQLRHYQQLERRNQQRGNQDWRRDDRRDDRGDWRNDRRGDDRRNWRDNRGGDRRDWNRNWRNDRRYDWRSWRNSNRNIFRGSRYYSPYRNWNYSRFSIGIFLEPLFYGQNYWIGDPYQYRLPAAYPGTQWVRYYNDVMLVDVYSGEVLDVIYDFFW